MNDVRARTWNVQSMSGILAHLCTRQHWLWVTVEPHISSARHEEAVAREGGRYAPVRRVSGSEPLSLRTHRHRGRSRPLRSAVVKNHAGSISSGLTPTLREDWSFRRALETPCHARIATSPWPHGHVSGPLVKIKMDTIDSRSNRLLGPETRPCVQ